MAEQQRAATPVPQPPGPRPVIVISGAPELRCVPQHFWKRLAAFLRDEKTGTVSFNVSRGRPSSLEARERWDAQEDG